MSDDRYRYDFFEPLTGKSFRIQFTDGSIDLTLEEVIALPGPRRASRSGGDAEPAPDLNVRQQPFTLTFRGPAQYRLPQRIYRMTGETVGEPLDVFIVPISVDANSVVYQAVFT